MKNEQKVILKEIEKQLQFNFKLNAVQLGCRVSKDTIYFKFGDLFIHGFWYVRFLNSEYQIVLRTNIKPYNYDSIFWRILDMEENENQKELFRANGAFVAPSVQVSEVIYNVSDIDNFEDFSQTLLKNFVEKSKEFILNTSEGFTDFDLYVLSLVGVMDECILKILANINLGNNESAILIAENEIKNGRTGRFENNGLGFNEYVINSYSKNYIKK